MPGKRAAAIISSMCFSVLHLKGTQQQLCSSSVLLSPSAGKRPQIHNVWARGWIEEEEDGTYPFRHRHYEIIGALVTLYYTLNRGRSLVLNLMIKECCFFAQKKSSFILVLERESTICDLNINYRDLFLISNYNQCGL